MPTLPIQARRDALRLPGVRPGWLCAYDVPVVLSVAVALLVGALTGVALFVPRPWMLPNLARSVVFLLAAFTLLGAARVTWMRFNHGRLRPLTRRIALARHLGPRSAWAAVRFAIAFELVALVSTTLIQRLPVLRPLPHKPRLPRVFDADVLHVETLLHLGVNPGAWLASLPVPSLVVRLLDALAAHWLIVVGLIVAYALTCSHHARAARFLATLLLVMLLCPLIALALPTTGPFLVRQDLLPAAGMTLAHEMQQARFHHWVMHLFPLRDGAMIFGFGLMGFPSLPAAALSACVLFTWRMWRPVRYVTLAAALLSVLGLLMAGWAYALSVYAGVALAAVAWLVVAVAHRRWGRPTKLRDAVD